MLGERWPIDILHDNVINLFVFLRAIIKNLNDVGVTEPCAKRCLPLKTGFESKIPCEKTVHDFDGNQSVKLDMARLIDFRHPSFANKIENLITISESAFHWLLHIQSRSFATLTVNSGL